MIKKGDRVIIVCLDERGKVTSEMLNKELLVLGTRDFGRCIYVDGWVLIPSDCVMKANSKMAKVKKELMGE